jgi:hypothetical protein
MRHSKSRIRLSKSFAMSLEPLEGRTMFAGDMVTHWNEVMMGMMRQRTPAIGPTVAARDMAVMDIAVFDAVNGIDGSYRSYLVKGNGPKGASEEAAAAQAAYRTLYWMFPSQQNALLADLADSLSSLGNSYRVWQGVTWGEYVANRVIAARTGDGSDSNVQYLPGTAPGQWQPDPLNPAQQAWGPGEGAVTPFVVKSTTQFLPPAPPKLTSTEYAAALNQVESLGAKNSTTRTADQTQIGKFWAYDHPGMGSPMVLYDQVVVTVAEQMHNSLVQNARLFALEGLANADAGFTAWEAKYSYNVWRPITAIRRANEDGNAATTADPNWVPLGAPGDGVVPDFTPPFPSYTSGHSTFGGATFEILKDFYGTDNIHFTLKSDELPGVTRTYSSFSQAAQENGMSRIYLGIHFSFDNIQGQASGRAVADYVMQHALQPSRVVYFGTGLPKPPHDGMG